MEFIVIGIFFVVAIIGIAASRRRQVARRGSQRVQRDGVSFDPVTGLWFSGMVGSDSAHSASLDHSSATSDASHEHRHDPDGREQHDPTGSPDVDATSVEASDASFGDAGCSDAGGGGDSGGGGCDGGGGGSSGD